jgi:hypothetical protein
VCLRFIPYDLQENNDCQGCIKIILLLNSCFITGFSVKSYSYLKIFYGVNSVFNINLFL